MGCENIEITMPQEAWLDSFKDLSINAILVGAAEMPDGRCGGSGCHTDTTASTLQFAPPNLPCSEEVNFLESVRFIDRQSPDTSPLTERPLGEPSRETGLIEHGGRVVFAGRDDPDRIMLLRWIAEGLED